MRGMFPDISRGRIDQLNSPLCAATLIHLAWPGAVRTSLTGAFVLFSVEGNCDVIYCLMHCLPSGIATDGCFHHRHKCNIGSNSFSPCFLCRGHGLSLGLTNGLRWGEEQRTAAPGC